MRLARTLFDPTRKATDEEVYVGGRFVEPCGQRWRRASRVKSSKPRSPQSSMPRAFPGIRWKIVDKGAAAAEKVGTCEGGTKEIVYKRGDSFAH
jgi:hypothetical protein